IYEAFANLDKLNQNTKDLINLVEKKNFLQKAMNFLPPIEEEFEINLSYLVFMHNAVVEVNTIFIDVPLFSKLTEDEINDLLAHEIHHYLKRYINTEYYSNSIFHKTNNFIRTLENEGIANLCNFKSLDRMYRLLGIFEGESVQNELKQVHTYLVDFFNQLCNNVEK